MAQRMIPCPHCGTSLPERASFCPYCAQAVYPRRTVRPPSPLWGKALRWGLGAAAILAVVAAVWITRMPRTYDAYGELIYTDADGTYQLLLGTANDRFTPVPDYTEMLARNEEVHVPAELFINHVDSGVNAGPRFLQKVESVSTELIHQEESSSPIHCAPPAPAEDAPQAALVSRFSCTGRSGTAEMVWTLHMKNKDTVRLRQTVTIIPVETYEYHYQDYPMNTAQELQALVDRISEEVPLPDEVALYLPPVTYNGSITIKARPMDFYGSADTARHRTTFTDTVRVAPQDGPSSHFYDIDFVGDGNGAGVSACAGVWAENCTFAHWKTGVLGYGKQWVNVIACQFTDDQIGLHLNSTGTAVTSTMYHDNFFQNNTTAVLLENVPADVAMNFRGSRFTGNGVDIDNRCGQNVDITQAIFE